MKQINKLKSAIILAAILLAVAYLNPQAKGDAKRSPGVVVISAQEVYPDDGKYRFQVWSVSSGPNSPVINVGADFAATLEYLKGLGYKITPLPTYLTVFCERD